MWMKNDDIKAVRVEDGCTGGKSPKRAVGAKGKYISESCLQLSFSAID